MSQAGEEGHQLASSFGFPGGGNTEVQGLHEHTDRCSEVGRLLPEVRDLPPLSVHWLVSRGGGQPTGRVRQEHGRGQGDEPEADVTSIFPKRLLWEP